MDDFFWNICYSYEIFSSRIQDWSDWRSAGGVDLADWETWQAGPRLYYAPNNLHATLDTDSHSKNKNRLIKHWALNFLFLNGKWSVLHLDPDPRIRMIASFGCTLHLLNPDWSDARQPGPRILRKLQIFQMRPTSDPCIANMEEFSKYQARNLYKRSVNMINKGVGHSQE